MTDLLRIAGLTVEFRTRERTVRAVKGLDLAVEAGQVVALVGESGSGKSVTAQAVMRLLPQPPAVLGGAIRWGVDGENILDMSDGRLRQLRGGEVGMIFQEPMTSLNPTWTCGAQVEEALELHGVADAAQRRVRALQLFREVGIPDPDRRLDQYPHELSGGMRQRVCIAMALACSPKLLIADEPTTALDVTIQAQIIDLLKALRRDRGMAVLFITHDLQLVAEFADRVVLMRHGEKVEEGPVAEVFANPGHAYTRALLACRPRLGSRGTRLATVEDMMAQEGRTP
jgi:ABC-type dipeptide/oligopeptide/nickel transport system ATPase component